MFVVMNVKCLKDSIHTRDSTPNSNLVEIAGLNIPSQELPSIEDISCVSASTSCATINNLPDEILLKIFAYLPVEDLVFHIPSTCKRWALCVDDTEVWKDKVYSPPPNSTPEDVENVLKQAPKLHAFHASSFLPPNAVASIIDAVTSNLLRVTKLSLPVTVGNCESVKNLLTEKYDSISFLVIRFCRSFLDDGSVERHVEDILMCIGMCPNLKSLTISGSILCRPCAFKTLGKECVSLQKLNIQNSNIHPSNIEYFLKRNAETIVSLILSWDFFGTRGTLPVVAEHCRNLEKLTVLEPDSMYGCKMTLGDFIALESMVNLKELSLPSLKDDILREFVDLFKKNVFLKLEKLDFSHSAWVKNSLLDEIFKSCTTLKHLQLQHCYEITSEGFQFIYLLSQLEYLNLEGCMGLRDDAILHIVRCKTLRRLNLSRLFVFKQDSLQCCIENLKSLQELRMIVRDISQEDIESVPCHLLTFLQFIKYCW